MKLILLKKYTTDLQEQVWVRTMYENLVVESNHVEKRR